MAIRTEDQKFTAHTLPQEVIPDEEIPEVLLANRPFGCRLTQYNGINLVFQWQMPLLNEWINYGQPIQLRKKRMPCPICKRIHGPHENCYSRSK